MLSRLIRKSQTNHITLRAVIAIASTAVIFTSACAPQQKGTLFYAAVGKNAPLLLVASAKTAANLGTNAVVSYDVSGNFLDELADLTLPNQRPRGLAPLDAFNFITALDGGTKMFAKNSVFGSYAQFGPSGLTGNLYQIARYDTAALFYAIIGNTIDAFDVNGNRATSSLNPVIQTTTGSCVLNGPRGLYIDSINKRLFVTNGGATSLLTYDLTNATAPTCQSTNSTMGAVTPTGIILHSSGYLYVVSSVAPATNVKLWALSGDGTGTATAVYTDASGTVLNGSTSIVELPDTTVLIANSGTGGIDKFQLNGLAAATRIGTQAFIKDAFTSQVNAMIVLKGQ